VFTSNLISQTTWLKVKLKLVNLFSLVIEESYGARALGDSFSLIDVGSASLPT